MLASKSLLYLWESNNFFWWLLLFGKNSTFFSMFGGMWRKVKESEEKWKKIKYMTFLKYYKYYKSWKPSAFHTLNLSTTLQFFVCVDNNWFMLFFIFSCTFCVKHSHSLRTAILFSTLILHFENVLYAGMLCGSRCV